MAQGRDPLRMIEQGAWAAEELKHRPRNDESSRKTSVAGQNQVTFVRVTSGTADADGNYPGVVQVFNADTQAWEEFGEVVLRDPGGIITDPVTGEPADPEADKRYACRLGGVNADGVPLFLVISGGAPGVPYRLYGWSFLPATAPTFSWEDFYNGLAGPYYSQGAIQFGTSASSLDSEATADGIARESGFYIYQSGVGGSLYVRLREASADTTGLTERHFAGMVSNTLQSFGGTKNFYHALLSRNTIEVYSDAGNALYLAATSSADPDVVGDGGWIGARFSPQENSARIYFGPSNITFSLASIYVQGTAGVYFLGETEADGSSTGNMRFERGFYVGGSFSATSTVITDFETRVLGIIQSLVTDTQTVNLTYDAGGPLLKADAVLQMSVTSDASGIKLVNDEADPGGYKIYGTGADPVGAPTADKGWYGVTTFLDGISTTQGSVLYRAFGGLGWLALAPGTSGQFLQTLGAAMSPVWADVVGVTDGDKGDITVSGSGTVWEIDAGAVGEAELADGAVTEAKLADGAVATAKLAAGAVTTATIAAGAVTATEIATGTITTTQIASGTIVAANIANNTITATQIANNTITSVQIAAGTITGTEIANGTITDVQLAADSVTTAKIVDLAVTTAKIDNLAVTTAKINDLAVTAAKLATDSVTTAKIVDLAVTTGKINDLAVTAGKLAADSVTTAKILDDNVTAAKLATDSVTTVKILNDNVTYAKIQNVSAESRALGRKVGAGAGDIQECTGSEILDMVGTAAQGDILYRGAVAWSLLGAGTSGYFLKTQGAGANPVWADAGGGGGDGTVTSVALTTPAFLSVAGSPVTTSGTLAVTLATQAANIVFAGPASGGAATPTFRALVADDIPDISTTYQPIDDNLDALAGLTGAADTVPYFTGTTTMALTPFPVAGRLAARSPLSYSGLWLC